MEDIFFASVVENMMVRVFQLIDLIFCINKKESLYLVKQIDIMVEKVRSEFSKQ